MSDGAEFKRSLGPIRLFSIAFGAIIGVGWLTLVGGWLQLAGPLGASLCFGVGCIAVLMIALIYAEVSLLVPRAGGEVAYADAAFGRGAAFTVGWALLLAYIAVIAFEMISVGWILGVMWPDQRGPVLLDFAGHQSHMNEVLVGCLALIVVTAANCRGANITAGLQSGLIVMKIGVSLVFVIAALFQGDTANLVPLMGPGGPALIGNFSSVFAVALMFYGGFNFLPQALEERAPGVRPRQIAFAMTASVFFAFIFYALIIYSTALLLPRAQLLDMDLPAAEAFERAFGSVLMRDLVLTAGLIGLLTAWNGTLFAASRILFLLGKGGLVPRVFARLHPGSGTPVNSVLAISAVGAVLAFIGRPAAESIVGVAAAAIPFAWAITVAAAFRLRKIWPNVVRPFTAPGGKPLFGVAFITATLAFILSAADVVSSGAMVGLISALTWIAIGVVFWGLNGRRALSSAGS